MNPAIFGVTGFNYEPATLDTRRSNKHDSAAPVPAPEGAQLKKTSIALGISRRLLGSLPKICLSHAFIHEKLAAAAVHGDGASTEAIPVVRDLKGCFSVLLHQQNCRSFIMNLAERSKHFLNKHRRKP